MKTRLTISLLASIGVIIAATIPAHAAVGTVTGVAVMVNCDAKGSGGCADGEIAAGGLRDDAKTTNWHACTELDGPEGCPAPPALNGASITNCGATPGTGILTIEFHADKGMETYDKATLIQVVTIVGNTWAAPGVGGLGPSVTFANGGSATGDVATGAGTCSGMSVSGMLVAGV